MHPIPEPFARSIDEVWEDEGRAWLESLPDLLEGYARRWSLVVGPPLEPLSYNYVAPATRRDGTEAVLKLGVPREEVRTEIAALRFYAGDGAVRLLEADDDACAMLLERLRPGQMLSTLGDDDRMTEIAASVMRRLWRPAPAGNAFPRLAEWFEGFDDLRKEFDGGTGPLDARLVAEAEGLSRDLLASTPSPVLLHADFHHYNVLSAEREPWVAIDPKGRVGDPAYDTSTLFYNALRTGWTTPVFGGCWRGAWRSSPRRSGSTGRGSSVGAWRRRCSRRGGATTTMATATSRRCASPRRCPRSGRDAHLVQTSRRIGARDGRRQA